ncbi:MAG TPA: ribbon-helix-helix protein, CopG family [Candidatus Binatia bacterium]|nr:ribbon-helix-helix protein, CopG family [Candidatus Binatia bacterium]
MPTRTTLTLDDDVAAALQREVRRSGRPLKVVVNDALRVGLERRAGASAEPFRVEAHDLGLREGIELDHVAGLLERIEGVEHR